MRLQNRGADSTWRTGEKRAYIGNMKFETLSKAQLQDLVRGLTKQMTIAKDMLAIDHPAQNVLAFDLDNIQAWQLVSSKRSEG
jgi:hypothetical protein